MDLYDRCICGLRLTPVSTKAVDVAGVLYETVHPRILDDQDVEALPAHGVPDMVVLDSRKLVSVNATSPRTPCKPPRVPPLTCPAST